MQRGNRIIGLMALPTKEKLWNVQVLDEDHCHPSCLPPSLVRDRPRRMGKGEEDSFSHGLERGDESRGL